jgi:recombination protein RecA
MEDANYKRGGQSVATTKAVMKEFIESFNKSRKKPILQLGSAVKLEPRHISSGIKILDLALNGGYRLGRISILVGDYSCGKTLLCQYAARSALEAGYGVVYIDTEQSFDPGWWRTIGVDTDKVAVAQTNDGEETFEVILGAIESGAGLVIVDSIAQIIPPQRMEGGIGDMGVGQLPRFLNDSFRLVLHKLNEHDNKTAILLTNQVRESLAPSYGGPKEVMPGGRGINHLAHLILKLRRSAWLTTKSQKKSQKYDVRSGFEIEVTLVKSKQSVPFQTVKIPFDFSSHLDDVAALVNEAIDIGLIEQRGSYYSWEGKFYQGRAGITEYFRSSAENLNRLLEILRGGAEQIPSKSVTDSPGEDGSELYSGEGG